MKCEYCKKDHNGKYGSGRFCSSYCSHGYTTARKRKNINDKVSKKLQGIYPKQLEKYKFKNGYDSNRYIGTSESAKVRVKRLYEQYEKMEWSELPINEKRRRILKEQNDRCKCGTEKWNNKKLILELHHKDGNNENNDRKNLEMLCPNCHSRTDTYRNRTRECIPIAEEIVSKTIK